MAAKKKIINIRVYFDGDQDAKEVFAEVIAQKIRDTKTKDKLAIMKDKQSKILYYLRRHSSETIV